MTRPYIVIKFAKSADNFIGSSKKQVWMTNNFSKRLVHKWRSEFDAILIGTNTALVDNPELSTRFNFGESPIRVVLDRKLRLPPGLKIFSGKQKTILLTQKTNHPNLPGVEFITLKNWSPASIIKELTLKKISSLIVEGGAQTIQSFLDAGLWDEMRVFRTSVQLKSGISAPEFREKVKAVHKLDTDFLEIFENALPSG